MKIRRIVVSDFMTNCYIYYNDNEAFIIDPGADAPKIRAFINEHQLKVIAILLTHGHIDHIGAAQVLSEQYQCDIYIHCYDEKLLRDPSLNLSEQFGMRYSTNVPVKFYLKHMEINGYEMIIHHTPGHTPGSVMIEFVKDHIIFSGDTLFNHSIGRTDFPSSNYQEMMQSIAYIKTLDYDCQVLPGHNGITTLQCEIHENPYFR